MKRDSLHAPRRQSVELLFIFIVMSACSGVKTVAGDNYANYSFLAVVLQGYYETLRNETYSQGIRVTITCPGENGGDEKERTWERRRNVERVVFRRNAATACQRRFCLDGGFRGGKKEKSAVKGRLICKQFAAESPQHKREPFLISTANKHCLARLEMETEQSVKRQRTRWHLRYARF